MRIKGKMDNDINLDSDQTTGQQYRLTQQDYEVEIGTLYMQISASRKEAQSYYSGIISDLRKHVDRLSEENKELTNKLSEELQRKTGDE
tara:strand:+ start:317 stop:583 length:267 start_codon:yes stop_codon:yes gene_type:complete